MQNITITVSQAGTAAVRTFAYKIQIDGAVQSERTLSPVQTQQVLETASQYFSLQQNAASSGAKDYLPLLRNGLFHLFLEAGGQDLAAKILPGARLTIASPMAEVLQLPWELLHLSSSPGDGESDCFAVIRQPGIAEGLVASSTSPRPGPLRVLFLAAEPLDHEEEEQAILKVAEGLDITLAICESGTWEELKERAESFRPHLVHLAGQAKVSGGIAVFSLQEATGRSDLRKAEELAAALKESGPVGIILSGMQSENPSAIHLLCQKLAESIPLAVAWNAPTSASKRLYQSLAAGRSMEEALLSVRREITAASAISSTQISVPAMYSFYDLPRIYDPQERAAATSPCRKLFALPGLIEGQTECFVDRRRDLLQLAAALREGSMQTLILTGPKGVGKSTLATYIARQLAQAGYNVLAVYSSPYNRISSARLLEAAVIHLSTMGQEALAKSLKDPQRTVRERLINLLEAMKTSRILMVWDDLWLDGKTGKISDPDLAEFYMLMLRGMKSSRVIITCKKLPADALSLPARARQWKLEGLGQAAFIRYLLQEEGTADRYKKGEISYAKLAAHYHAACGHPARLAQIGKALGQGDLAAGEDPLAKLISRLSSASSHALSQAAVYDIAISLAGLAAVCSTTEEQAGAYAVSWQDLSLAYFAGELWALPSSLRASLLAALSIEEQRAAQKAAGDFLSGLAEAGRCAQLGLSRLDALLEARGHYLASGDAKNAIAVTSRISGYLQRRGYFSELIMLNQQLLDLKMPNATPIAWIAKVHLDQGEYRKAAEYYDRALQIAPHADAYHGLGTALMHQEKYDLARENLQKSAEAYRALGDLSGEAASMSRLATIDMLKGENDAASDLLQKIAEIMKSLGDIKGEAAVLQEMARLDMIKRDYDGARQTLAESLELLKAAGDRKGAAFALFNLASLNMEKGDFSAAGAEFAEVLPLFQENGDRSGEAAILQSLGMIHSQAGEKEKAVESFQKALRINQELADKPAEAGAFFQLGALAVQQDKMQEGLRLMALAAIVLRSIKSDDVKNVEPLVERLAANLSLTQEQFMVMVQEVLQSYTRDRGWGLVERAWGK
jgi:tetratricopeptide (TPR) repeat protein